MDVVRAYVYLNEDKYKYYIGTMLYPSHFVYQLWPNQKKNRVSSVYGRWVLMQEILEELKSQTEDSIVTRA